MSTMPLANITGGTYSFASLGSGAVLVLNTSGGVVTSLNVVGVAGSGYAVGDLITPQEGNYDAVLQVATLSGSGVATINVLYGGTGYPGPVTGSLVAVTASTFPFTLTLAGTLTTNATVIMPNGTYLAASNQWIVNNNTTGAHTVTFFVSNGSDATTGSGVPIPQGSNNSTATFIQTDGATDIWLAAASVGIVNGVVPAGASLDSTGGTITATALNQGETANSTLTAEPIASAPTATLQTASGNCSSGPHIFAITFITAYGETPVGTASGSVTCASGHAQVALSSIPTGSAAVTGRNVYAQKFNDPNNFYLVSTAPVIADNTTTTYTFNLAETLPCSQFFLR